MLSITHSVVVITITITFTITITITITITTTTTAGGWSNCCAEGEGTLCFYDGSTYRCTI